MFVCADRKIDSWTDSYGRLNYISVARIDVIPTRVTAVNLPYED